MPAKAANIFNGTTIVNGKLRQRE